MSQFRSLLHLLEQELDHQEKLLELLTKERAAIVRLNQDELDQLTQVKQQLLDSVNALEIRRKEAFVSIIGNDQGDIKGILAKCPPNEGRREMERTSFKLRSRTEQVRELNAENGVLIRQTLGIVSSTLSILNSVPGSELPTYGSQGKISEELNTESRFATRRGVTREA